MAKIKKIIDNIPEKDEKNNSPGTLPEQVGVGESAEKEPVAEAVEKKEEKITEEVLRGVKDKIEKTDLDDKLKAQAQTQADDVKNLDEQNKLKNLLEIAKQKGVVYAVHVAKKMNDPYLLDALHDALAKEGHYKEFIK